MHGRIGNRQLYYAEVVILVEQLTLQWWRLSNVFPIQQQARASPVCFPMPQYTCLLVYPAILYQSPWMSQGINAKSHCLLYKAPVRKNSYSYKLLRTEYCDQEAIRLAAAN